MRSLKYGEFFQSQVDDLELHVPGIRNSIVSLAAALLKDPEIGAKVREIPPQWFIPLPDIAPSPLGISYIFDETEVRLLSIWIS